MITEELIEACRNGDEQAYEQLYNMYKRKIIQSAYLIVHDQALAEDILQETFINCFKKLHTLKQFESFNSWIFKIMTRLCWRAKKSNATFASIDELDAVEIVGSIEYQPEHYVVQKQYFGEMNRIIASLNIKHRTVVVLHYYNEFSTHELSRILGISEGTVKSRLHYARKLIEKKLEVSESKIITNYKKELTSHAR